MRITVSDIPRKGLDLEYDTDPVALDLADVGTEFVTGIHLQVRLTRMDRVVFVAGEASTQARVQCVRCLEAVPFPMHLLFQMNIEPRPPEFGEAPGKWHELDQEELDKHYYSGDTLDLAELVREQTLLALPVHPLCRVGCRGLCPQCGLDRNQMSCRCGVEETPLSTANFQERLKKVFKTPERSRQHGPSKTQDIKIQKG